MHTATSQNTLTYTNVCGFGVLWRRGIRSPKHSPVNMLPAKHSHSASLAAISPKSNRNITTTRTPYPNMQTNFRTTRAQMFETVVQNHCRTCTTKTSPNRAVRLRVHVLTCSRLDHLRTPCTKTHSWKTHVAEWPKIQWQSARKQPLQRPAT